MKIITLNTWGARAGLSGLRDFFEAYGSAEIFCLQEIWQTTDLSTIEPMDTRIFPTLFEEIKSWLPKHKSFFRPQFRSVYGLAIFVREDLHILAEGEIFVFREKGFENPEAPGNHARNIQYVTLQNQGEKISIINLHGLWNGNGKSDSADRIVQSEKIRTFLKSLDHPHIVAGDFNLTPDTRSFKILTEICPQDFVTQYGITSTPSKANTPITFWQALK